MNYSQHFSTVATPQTEAIPGKPMVPNSAGGFGFAVDDWIRLDRFLILGSEGGSYYASERSLTIENAQAVLRCAQADGARTVGRIVEISESGRAPKNDPAIFALAICAGQKEGSCPSGKWTSVMALEALPKVARIGTHLFSFLEAVEKFRGHGRMLNRALQHWYLDKEPEQLAYQLIKYQQRNGWSHRDVLRLCKPKAEGLKSTMLGWAVGKRKSEDLFAIDGLGPIIGFENAKVSTDKREVCRLIQKYNLPRECVPTHFLTEPEVWEALLERMPMTAMIRNLATMTRVGLLKPMSNAVGEVLKELTNEERIRKSRLHPVVILMALKTYAQGHGEKGQNTWTPVPQIIDALDGAFYRAFGNVEPTGKRWLIAIDVSGSMGSACAGTPLTCCEGATAMALVTAHVEQNYGIVAFNHGLQPLPISARSRLDDALQHTRNVNFGGTDCSLPMTWATQNNVLVDTFVVLTDSETWAGSIHPCQALRQYRQRTGIKAKCTVVGMTSNGFTIADPEDGGMMDVVGMDSSVPQLIADFVRG